MDFLTEVSDEMNAMDPESKNIMDYPKAHTEWSKTKVRKYEENLVRMFYDENYNDYLGCFELMVKSGEVNTTVQLR